VTVTHRPLLALMTKGARWVSPDHFPGSSLLADACEEWLRFIERNGPLDHYLPRLRDRAAQRDETLAEIQAAYFLDRQRHPVVSWVPPKGAKGVCEFCVAVPGPVPTMAVEVKAPGWEADITGTNANARRKGPKYPAHIETRSSDPWGRLRERIDEACGQLPATMPTLFIVNDDLVFGPDSVPRLR
jgi:hypothetical protein